MPGVHCVPLSCANSCKYALRRAEREIKTQHKTSSPLSLVRARWQATGELVFIEIGDGSPGDLPKLLRTALGHLKVGQLSLSLAYGLPAAWCIV